MTAPLNPAPTMQYLIPSMTDCLEENSAISSELRIECSAGTKQAAATSS
jgi:hypothetical protein